MDEVINCLEFNWLFKSYLFMFYIGMLYKIIFIYYDWNYKGFKIY